MYSEILSDICSHLVRSPEAPALISADGIVTFGALADRVTAIRAALDAQPAGPRLILGHKEPDCVAAMIACALAGHPFVFADRSYPVQRINRIAEVAGAARALVAGAVPDGLLPEATALSQLSVSTPAAGLAAAPRDEDAIFYVIFTSGSTGEPKGVPISWSNYAALHRWYAPLLAKAPLGAHVNHSSFAFDMGMFDLWPSLSLGRAVNLLDHQNNILPRRNVSQLRACTTAGPSSWASTPSLLQLMCSDPAFDQSSFPDLQFFVVGGELFPRPLIRDLQRRFPKARIFNGYGPSEATCCTHLRLLGAADATGEGPLSLGGCVGASQMRIIDEDGQDLPIGQPGEVVLIGPQVVQGYLPENHPANRAFGFHNGQRSYRTGDLGRIEADGALTLLGRIDRQVKWLGNRIELDEIERAASEFPAVRKAACVPQKENGRVIAILLFLETGSGAPAPREAVLEHLARFLPAPVIPRDLRFVERLPVTINGKVDARALLAEAEPA
jgi:D-alanine--poly(phosphoribitol) ligase subunit 1